MFKMFSKGAKHPQGTLPTRQTPRRATVEKPTFTSRGPYHSIVSPYRAKRQKTARPSFGKCGQKQRLCNHRMTTDQLGHHKEESAPHDRFSGPTAYLGQR